VPFNSWAKFRVRRQGNSDDPIDISEYVKFHYVWRNTTDKYIVINANAYLSLNGYGTAQVGGGWFPMYWADLQVAGRLEMLKWWIQPPVSPLRQHSQFWSAIGLDVTANGLHSTGEWQAAHVFQGRDLSHSLMLVPPLGTVVFEVGVWVTGSVYDDASIEADFASGGFQVRSPGMLVTVLT
jgi:hypothetical protein